MTVYIKENTTVGKFAAIFLKERRMAVTIGNTICLYNCPAKEFFENKNLGLP